MSLDFYWIATRPGRRNNVFEICPKYNISAKTKDLMIRYKDFYAVYVPETGLWSKREDDILERMDRELWQTYEEKKEAGNGLSTYEVKLLRDSDSGSIERWHKFCQSQMRDVWEPLDSTVIFSNSEVKREDHASFRLNYPIGPGDCSASREIIDELYEEPEATKIYYAIGAVIAGYSKYWQKFCVFYGPPRSGKSTVLNMIQRLFGNCDPEDETDSGPEEKYWRAFKAENLGKGESFALEPLKDNPLIGIDHEAKLDNLENNTYLNTIASHDVVVVNVKNAPRFSMRFNTLLMMGTNSLVRITDLKSGLLRRMIDIIPSGKTIPADRYDTLVARSKMEKGAFAQYCLDVFKALGPRYYDHYVARNMISATNPFYEFVQYQAEDWMNREFVPLSEIWRSYVGYCEDSGLNKPQRQRVKNELMNYFHEFKSDYWDENHKHYSSVYVGFLPEKVGLKPKEEPVLEAVEPEQWIDLKEQPSLFDIMAKDWPAQYPRPDGDGALTSTWANCKTVLGDLDTHLVHHVRTPVNHIVIDFDMKEGDQKSLEKNIEAARSWPPTYAEVSKSGGGLHLHYIYNGDPTLLDSIYSDHVEVKVFSGLQSLRRKLTLCNDLPVAVLSGGLPLKQKGDKVADFNKCKDDQHLHNKIAWLMTKPKGYEFTSKAMSRIKQELDEAYKAGYSYNVTDMYKALEAFAWNSTNNASGCVALLSKCKLMSKDNVEKSFEDFADDIDAEHARQAAETQMDALARKVFFDVEVYPNFFCICWKYEGAPEVNAMVEPTSEEVELFIKQFNGIAIGFNNRKYDNHIIFGRAYGFNDARLYRLSQDIINAKRDAFFREAYTFGYADIYDYSSKKQSLKKWEIELGIHHREMDIPWDQDVSENRRQDVVEYCKNDVVATEAVYHATKQDLVAREILADLSGLQVINTTRQHTTRIIFGNTKNPQLEYTDLSKTFPGYEFIDGKNMYRGLDVGFGGYVYAEPGMYTHVALLDVASLHPNSIRAMNVFGEYTKNYTDILDARVAIKHHDYDAVKGMLDGKLAKYLSDDESADKLAQALKIVINSVYGYTSATFDNPFRDPRNVNNIVALRGALFMVTLQQEVQARGFTVAHIKTDSIKIPDATPEIIQFCMDFGKQYGYTFEHEATYEKMCLVNDAVYIAKYEQPGMCEQLYGYTPKDNFKANNKGKYWTATGKQFQVPYVFKTLFSGEIITFDDLCETRSVSKGDIYLDMNEGLGENEHDYRFVGRVGLFCPVKDGCGGGIMYRKVKGTGVPGKIAKTSLSYTEYEDYDGGDKYYSVAGTKGYRWLEAEYVRMTGKEDDVDHGYYHSLVDDAKDTIAKYGDVEWFRSDETVEPLSVFMNMPTSIEDEVPWDE